MSHKVFKIERHYANTASVQPVEFPHHQHNQMMDAINDIKNLLAERAVESEVPTQLLDSFRNDMAEAAKIKHELDIIQRAIDKTKFEIAALRLPGEDAPDITRMTTELSAIVSGTENATESILSSVEHIEEDASDLHASVTTQNQQNLVSDIHEHVLKIYEACNFQDLTGQRISKVIRAFGFIERRVEEMMEIWGGIDSFKGFEPPPVVDKGRGEHLLNGPALHIDDDVASQDDIDALFD